MRLDLHFVHAMTVWLTLAPRSGETWVSTAHSRGSTTRTASSRARVAERSSSSAVDQVVGTATLEATPPPQFFDLSAFSCTWKVAAALTTSGAASASVSEPEIESRELFRSLYADCNASASACPTASAALRRCDGGLEARDGILRVIYGRLGVEIRDRRLALLHIDQRLAERGFGIGHARRVVAAASRERSCCAEHKAKSDRS